MKRKKLFKLIVSCISILCILNCFYINNAQASNKKESAKTNSVTKKIETKKVPKLLHNEIKGTYKNPDKYASKKQYIVDESIGKWTKGEFEDFYEIDEQKLIDQVKKESGKKEIKIYRLSNLKSTPSKNIKVVEFEIEENDHYRLISHFTKNGSPVYFSHKDKYYKRINISIDEFLKYDLFILDKVIIKHPRMIEHNKIKYLSFDHMHTGQNLHNKDNHRKTYNIHDPKNYNLALSQDFGSKYRVDQDPNRNLSFEFKISGIWESCCYPLSRENLITFKNIPRNISYKIIMYNNEPIWLELADKYAESGDLVEINIVNDVNNIRYVDFFESYIKEVHNIDYHEQYLKEMKEIADYEKYNWKDTDNGK